MTYSRTLSSIYPNGDVQKGKWLNTGGTTTGNYWDLVDEAIASANDADYIRGTGSGTDNSTETYIADIGATPTDFVTMASLSYNVRYRQFNRVDDTISFTILITNSSGTALTNTVTISNVTTTTFTNSGATAFTLTSAGTSATKTTWDAARLVIGQVYSASMAADGAYIAISAIELTGTYNAYRPELKYYNGSTWIWKPLFVYIGGQWVYKTLKRWDGTQWVREPD